MPPSGRRIGRPTWLVVAGTLLVGCVLAAASADGFDPDADVARPPVAFLPRVAVRGATVIRVQNASTGHPIRSGFVGLSLEYTALKPYVGSNPRATNPVLVQLIRNLAPGQQPVVRIGGDSTDWAWWPVRGLHKPVGIRIVLGPRFGSTVRTLVRALDARLILGVNLEADSPRLAAVEAERLVQSFGRGSVEALELGNEPELYGDWPWLVRHGHRIMARAAGYGAAAYLHDFRSIAAALPDLGLAGPALGGPLWIRHVAAFVAAAPRLALATVHAYPLQRCYTPLGSMTYPTIAHLLDPGASEGLAAGLSIPLRAAHAHGLPLRVDELNSVSCGGTAGVSDTFASALWALDTMFALARAGVDGVNIHTFQSSLYRLFGITRWHGHWRASVAPEYYGLMLFARAAPPGARVLRVSGGGGTLRAWATRTPSGTTRIVLINEAISGSRVVAVRGAASTQPAAYEALRAPSVRARQGVSLGGVSFGATTATGVLPGARRMVARPASGAYVLRLPAASAVMLTAPGRPAR